MNKIRLLPGIAVLAISGCDVGYKDDGGAPIYVTWDEGQGLREWPIKGADAATFEVLRQDAFPRDASTFLRRTLSKALTRLLSLLSQFSGDGTRTTSISNTLPSTSVMRARLNSWTRVGNFAARIRSTATGMRIRCPVRRKALDVLA